MEPRRLRASRGWSWIVDALRIFRRRPLVWLMLNTLLLFIGSVLMLVPLIGPLVFALLTPVLMAGLMLGCRDVERGGKVEIAHLVLGFKHHGTQLVTVGGVYLAGQVVVAGVMFYVGGEDLRSVATGVMQSGAQSQAVPASTDRLSFALLVGAALFTPLAMAVWFAPPLVALEGLRAFDALKASIRACLGNLLPMLVYGAGLTGLLVLSLLVVRGVLWVLPAGVGFLRGLMAVAGFMLWVTLTLISVYTSYRDVFARSQPAHGDGE
jgi:uncharacterized membrane protein